VSLYDREAWEEFEAKGKMKKVKFRNRKFDVIERLEWEDGTIELQLRGTRHAEYVAKLPPNSEKWELVYNSVHGGRTKMYFDKSEMVVEL